MKTLLIIFGLYLAFIIIKELFIDPSISRRNFIKGEIKNTKKQYGN